MSEPTASIAQYKAALRREKRRRGHEMEIDFLNITAMLDMMTIILVFLLKNMSASSASISQSNDLQIPVSILTDEPNQEGIKVTVTKSQILVGDESSPIVKLPSRESLAQSGLDANYKKNGINDLYVVPLGDKLLQVRQMDKQIRQAKNLDPNSSEAILIVDKTTPYRLLVEVLYTLGQSEFGRYHIQALSGKAGGK